MNTDTEELKQEENYHDRSMREYGEWRPVVGSHCYTGQMRIANGKLQQRSITEWTRWDGHRWTPEKRATWEPVPEVMIDLSEPKYEVVG